MTQSVDFRVCRAGRFWCWAALEEQKEVDEILSQILSKETLNEIDLFDRVQLAHVVQVSRDAGSLSDAGRRFFGSSRARKSSANDADRLRKYLNRFGIDWAQVVKLSTNFS